MITENTITVDGRSVPIDGEPNLLSVIRKANIDIPTFCYHSELSVYGACRLCIVDLQGTGIVASCSTAPVPGMIVRTQTDEIREMRKISVELLLANHHQGCTTCAKSASCKLLDLSRRLGVDKVRFKPTPPQGLIDSSSAALIRDPNKCILCGDCVRYCSEIQGIGAIDFVNRGAKTQVMPAFGKDLNAVECVYCGQCAAVCPTGAIVPRPYVNEVWKELNDPGKKVVVQVAPAVRVALGEEFGMAPGSIEAGRMAAALRTLGFDQVYDTCFAADMTVIEEATEFIARLGNGKNLPQFTSCCPAWVKFAEQYFPELLPNLSSCKSPQQMFGAVAREILPKKLETAPENLVVVSIMPCTAKKYEAQREEFSKNGQRDVDYVLTTQELARMIKEAGIRFADLEPEAFDLPMGFKTGAGVIFGATGGVTEAALRFAYESVTGKPLDNFEFHAVRGNERLKEATIDLDGTELRLAVVHGLKQARELAEQIRRGQSPYHFIEVMACPGGCIGGAGQPVAHDPEVRKQRARGIYRNDQELQLHKSQDNPYVSQCYNDVLGDVGGHRAHELLHTHYSNRKRIEADKLELIKKGDATRVDVDVCVGTSCFLRGSQKILKGLLGYVADTGLEAEVAVKAHFCHERCGRGPVVVVNETVLEHCDLATAKRRVQEELKTVCPAEVASLQ